MILLNSRFGSCFLDDLAIFRFFCSPPALLIRLVNSLVLYYEALCCDRLLSCSVTILLFLVFSTIIIIYHPSFLLQSRCIFSYLCRISTLLRLFSTPLPFGLSVVVTPDPLAPLLTSSWSFCLRVLSSDSLGLYFPICTPPLYLVPTIYLCRVLSVVVNLVDKKCVGTCCFGIILSIKYL